MFNNIIFNTCYSYIQHQISLKSTLDNHVGHHSFAIVVQVVHYRIVHHTGYDNKCVWIRQFMYIRNLTDCCVLYTKLWYTVYTVNYSAMDMAPLENTYMTLNWYHGTYRHTGGQKPNESMIHLCYSAKALKTSHKEVTSPAR